MDAGQTWSDWKTVKNVHLANGTCNAYESIYFEDGIDNFIRWQAMDIVSNGPAISDNYRILVDTQNVFFSDPFPNESEISAFEKLEVGITISDTISGVKSSTIEYAISTDSGNTWNSWVPITGFKDGNLIDIKINPQR